FGAVVSEAACIGGLGVAAGFVVYFVLFTVVAGVIRAQTGVVLDVWSGGSVLWLCPVAMVALCALGGVVPAIKAYRIPVAETLAPIS
ncbi:MAG TPA: ABC transporter permease, partial [Opitutaceae bacterium]|nr:ABC transporter permease [Opitutaceae bacterium]